MSKTWGNLNFLGELSL